MIGRFLWGTTWRTTAFVAVVGAGLAYANRGPDWTGQQVIEAGDDAIEGKAGVLVVALMQPSRFEAKFYNNFVEKIFNQVIPWPVNVLAGADSGIVLVDPDQPYRQDAYVPDRLVDLDGNETDIDGVPWVEKYRRGELRWEKPSTTVPHDFGFYLYPARRQGMRTAAAKTVAKSRYIYYPALEAGYLPHFDQTYAMAQGAINAVAARHPIVAGQVVDAFDPWQKEQAVTAVLDAGADTLVLASAQPIYSDFEELSGSFVAVRDAVEKWRKRNGNKPVKIVIAPYMAATEAYQQLILDHFRDSVPAASGPGQSAIGVLTLHGLPSGIADSWDDRVARLRGTMTPRIARILRDKGYDRIEALMAPEGFADDVEDPDDRIVSVHEIYERAIADDVDVVVAVPFEFLAENTDSLFSHSAEMFNGFPGYATYQGPPRGTDWSRPYVRNFTIDGTRVVYAGAPGGKTLPRQSATLAAAISSLFE